MRVRGGKQSERGGDKQWRGQKEWTAHLPDGSFGSIQQGVMAVLHYVMSLPDCDTAVEAKSVLTLPMCVLDMIFPGASGSRQHMVLKTQTKL